MNANDLIPSPKWGSVVSRFWSKVAVSGPDDCWLWTPPPGKVGYGVLNVWNAGKTNLITAHRLSYVIHYGAIPDGLFVCHHCDVRLCVNPAHLFLGTDADNKRDMVKKNRQHRPAGELSSLAKLTTEQVQAILKDTRPAAKIAADYGIAAVTVHQVQTGRSWAHIIGPRRAVGMHKHPPEVKAAIMADDRPSTVVGREYGIPHGTIRMWRLAAK